RIAKADTVYEWDPGYGAYQKINTLNAIGDQLLELGYPVDAVRLYNDVLSDTGRLAQANRFSGDYVKQRAQQGPARALGELKPDTLAKAVRELLSPKNDPKATGPVLDLLVLVQNRDLSRASLSSMMASTLKSAMDRSELQAEVKSRLAELS